LPLRWTANQLGGIAPTLGLIAILVLPTVLRSGRSGYGGFPRRYVTALALGPFLLTTGVSLLTGRQPVAMWGYPFWSFAPLAILMWLEPRLEATQRRLPGFAMAFAGVFALFPFAYGINVFGVSLVSDPPHSEQFQGQLLADTVTRAFRERTQGPLVYVGGDEFFSNNVAVYSADRPHVIVDGDLKKSPWVDPKELAKRGAVIFPDLNMTEERRNDLLRSFPGAEFQQPLFLPRKTLVPRTPIKIDWAIVPPQR